MGYKGSPSGNGVWQFYYLRRLEGSSNQKMHEAAAFEKVQTHSIPAQRETHYTRHR